MKSLLRVGRGKSGPRLNTPHTHDTWELVLYTQGHGQVLAPDRAFPFQRGAAFLMPPGFLHGERSTSGYESYWVSFTGFRVPKRFLHACEPPHRPLTQLFRLLYHEHKVGPQEALCAEYLDLFLSCFLSLAGRSHEDRLVEDLKHLLVANIDNASFRFKENIAAFGLSGVTLHARFKASVGMTPIQYLIDQRLREACRLLSIPELTVARIAEQVGFADAYHFSRLFKAKLGVAPAPYRRTLFGP
ncbi:MAG: helix-turn-helix transcriptional regulator [Spirochaetes bacterium]|nr:helix-turn-helix transcriptional regulator [Spirochaetota bacterium]